MNMTAQDGGIAQNQGENQAQAVQQPQVQQPQVTPQLPAQDSVSDRTSEQFQKLIESNRKLFEANEQLRREMEARATAPVQQPAQQPQKFQQPQTQVDPSDFIERDPVTGEQYINESKMKARIREIEERANRAENKINSFVQSAEQQERQRQERETFASYPELEPGNEKFDANFHRQVRGVLYDSALFSDDYGGRALTFKEAADLVRGQTPTSTQTPTNGGNTSGQQSAGGPENATKEQGSAQVMSQPQNAPRQTTSEELEQLRMATRLGNDEALAARIVATDHVLKNE